MIELSHGQITLIILLAWVSGFFSALAFFYPLGRRHGIEAVSQHLRASDAAKKVEGKEIIETLARNVGAKIRGGSPTTN